MAIETPNPFPIQPQEAIKARASKIKDLLSEDKIMSPGDVLNFYITDIHGNPEYELGLHAHAGLVHTFREWETSIIFNVPALDPWLGNDNEMVNFEERAKILFDLFVMELNRRGAGIDKETKEDAFWVYLND